MLRGNRRRVNYLLIGIGGAAGSVARYGIGREAAKRSKTTFPYGTLLVNVAGAFLLGIVSSIHGSDNVYILLGDGFLGAFTTFSTFMFEGVTLIRGNERLNAIVYIGVSLILGVSGYILGVYAAGLFFLA